MKLDTKLKRLCEKSEIEIVSIDTTKNIVDVLLPYESSAVAIEFYGDTDDEQIDSFKEELNRQLDRMIDHLNDCKLD
jgi:hypothetical protein